MSNNNRNHTGYYLFSIYKTPGIVKKNLIYALVHLIIVVTLQISLNKFIQIQILLS
jgi:hypothetical protein